jgi:hypothetical protein
MGFENINAHDPDSKESFCFAPGVPVFLQKRSSCLLLIHPKAIML